MTDPCMVYIYMLTKLVYIDGKWQTIYGIHTNPMGNKHPYFLEALFMGTLLLDGDSPPFRTEPSVQVYFNPWVAGGVWIPKVWPTLKDFGNTYP